MSSLDINLVAMSRSIFATARLDNPGESEADVSYRSLSQRRLYDFGVGGRRMGDVVKRKGGRLALAMRARDLFVPYVLARGRREVATFRAPAYWYLESWNHRFAYIEGVLLLPTDKTLSCTFDVWSGSFKKQLSVSWEPERPWQPPHIANFDARGSWIPLLDLVPPLGKGA